eukprot:454977_1
MQASSPPQWFNKAMQRAMGDRPMQSHRAMATRMDSLLPSISGLNISAMERGFPDYKHSINRPSLDRPLRHSMPLPLPRLDREFVEPSTDGSKSIIEDQGLKTRLARLREIQLNLSSNHNGNRSSIIQRADELIYGDATKTKEEAKEDVWCEAKHQYQ